jgi:hypothetical protein
MSTTLLSGTVVRIDRYTKTILTLIALLLAVIALKPIFQPDVAMAQEAQAQARYGHMLFSYSAGQAAFFDTRSGDVWTHDNAGHFQQHYKVKTWGKDLDRDHDR